MDSYQEQNNDNHSLDAYEEQKSNDSEYNKKLIKPYESAHEPMVRIKNLNYDMRPILEGNYSNRF